MEKATRNTRQRTVILNALREVTSHPTADEIFAMTRESLPRISLGTVYRNLELLTRQGEIRCLENGSAQKRFAGNTEPHPQVPCSVCGKIADVDAVLPVPDIGEISVDGFTVTGVSILFEGVCDNCKV
ncbi:MAG: transcriptional repressor [Deltaproteobacteria bacterium]|nr:transcriptional repressor [Deltaproteobacteria bacterium]